MKRNIVIILASILVLTCLFAFARVTTTDLGLVLSIWTEEEPEYDILVDLITNWNIIEDLANDSLEFDTGERLEDRVGAMVTGSTQTFATLTYQDSDNTIDIVVPVKDEDSMTSNSATFLCTQQSIKAYADTLHALQYLKTEIDSLTEVETIYSKNILDTTELNTFSELQALVADKTLVNEEDVFTIDANWVNTANPWADNEVSDTLTASNLVAGSSVVSDSEVDNNITINLSTLATTITVTDNESTNENNPLCFVAGADPDGGSLGIETDGDLHYNPSTGTVTSTTFAGALTGNSTTTTTASAGDAAVDFFGAGVDAVTDATTCTDIEGTLLSIATGTLNAAIPADHITYDMMQDTTDTDKVLGRSTAGAGTVEEIACTSAGRDLIDDADTSAQRTTLGLVIGTNVLAEQTIGIANDNLLEVDDASAADNEFAKFTANGLEGRSYSETMKDLNPVTTVTTTHTMTVAEAGTVLVNASSAYTIILPTAVGNAGLTYCVIKTDANYNCVTFDANGAETINYENSTGAATLTYGRLNTYCAEATFVSDGSNWQVYDEALGQIPECEVTASVDQDNLVDGFNTIVALNTEAYDIGSNFDNSTWVSGTADENTLNHLVDDATTPFLASMVGYMVKNTTDTTYATIIAFVDTGDVELSTDIFPLGTENYEIKHAKFVVPIAGKYLINARWVFSPTVAYKLLQGRIFKNTTTVKDVLAQTSMTGYFTILLTHIDVLSASDYIRLLTISDAEVDTVDLKACDFIVRLISKD